ncbi:MAG TPA: 3-methyl-2-oxobutanoate hydroxymethyltransferase [Thermomicrobiales bacterium]|jgi:3-methyl-2-oxobutanoate hydroxymethyltransferase|nr:3-methyl-2-oxobutanoate hydroxymethyltransferase [Chloroflexota bacterium]HQZ89023.1 3-methyl-2-oxobutanoate hydroxymethyltransferase [Thermomicrobiales bacterium]
MTNSTTRDKITAPAIQAMKGGDRIVMVTAYDYPTARAVEAAGLESILVGDSLGMVVLGYQSTIPVTMEEMLHHTRAVMRGVETVHVVADLPFMSYQVSDAQAVENAGRLMKEGGADAVKLEGGRAVASRIEAIVRSGIPVMAHIGLTPQASAALGGFKVQGRSLDAARGVIDDALAVEAAGAYAVVVEAVPRQLARIITTRLRVPTIGIGAGLDCDGQVLVNGDLLGSFDRFIPRFAKKYANLAETMRDAFAAFASEVRAGEFPTKDHGFAMSRDVIAALEAETPVE